MYNLNKRDFIDVFDVILIIAIGSFFIVGVFVLLVTHNKNSAGSLSETATTTSQEIAKKPYSNPFAQLRLEAKAVYVYDIEKQEAVFSYNSTESLPLASLTKLMTAYTASKVLTSTQIVPIYSESLAEEGDTGLLPDEKWNLNRLIDFTLLVSSNDGANALAVAGQRALGGISQGDGQTFVGAMNQNSESLKLPTLRFFNETGLDVNQSQAGGYGSAEDIAKLMGYILHTNPSLLSATAYDTLAISSQTTIHNARNTNAIVNRIPGIIASKTGFSDLAGGNLMVAVDVGLNHPVIIAVLGSSYDGRFSDMQKLVTATLNHYSQGE